MTRRILLILAVAFLPAASVHADVITQWNTVLLDMIKADNLNNQLGGRATAMMHVAMFDAVNAVSGQYTSYHASPAVTGTPSMEAAAASAAYGVLTQLYPAKTALFDATYNAQLAGIADGQAKTDGISLGASVAGSIIALRAADGASTAGSAPYFEGSLPGQWRRLDTRPAQMPGWGSVTPWAMTSGVQFRQDGPPNLTSPEYADAYNQTKDIGSKTSTVRTAAQSETARFWVAGIPTMWNQVARQATVDNSLSLVDSARLFALLNIGIADAGISGWDMKYYYNFWRPTTAIRLGDSDGNDATVGDAAWESYLAVPPFPEYVSGHSNTCATAATILASVLGDDYTFTMLSDADPTLSPRTFDSFMAAAQEAGMSRIYAGLHFGFSNDEGLLSGQQLGGYVAENYLTPIPEPASMLLLLAGAAAALRRRRTGR